jgi:hypothetical protein
MDPVGFHDILAELNHPAAHLYGSPGKVFSLGNYFLDRITTCGLLDTFTGNFFFGFFFGF